MSGNRRKKNELANKDGREQPADDPAKARGGSAAEVLERAHRRLRHVYEISKILVRFDSIERTIPEVFAVVAQAIPLQSAIFILETDRAPRTMLWPSDGESGYRLRTARAHAQEAYRYLVGSAVDLEAGSPLVVPGEGSEPPVQAKKSFIFLPLAVAHRPVFGALQFETAARLEELDLVLLSAVVNQVSIAVDRHLTLEAKQANTEARRRGAEDRQVTAEAGRARAEREQVAAQAERVEADRGKEAARAERDDEAHRRAAAEEAEQRARDQRDFILAVTGSLGEGVIAVDLDGQVTLFNPAAARMLGSTQEDALGELVEEILQIQRMDGTPIAAEEWPFDVVMRRGGSPRSGEQLFSSHGQPAFAVAYTAAALRRDGRISGAVLAFQDITNRKHAEEVTARLAAIVTSSDDAILSNDLQGVIRTWNDGATRLFGYTAEEAIGRRVGLLIPPDRVDEEPRILKRVRRGETVKHYDTARQRKDGGRLEVSLTVSPIRDAAGQLIGASRILHDITYRKQAEEARRRTEMEQRLLAEVATIVASSLDRRATLSAVARCVVPLLADICLIDEVLEDGRNERREVVFADEKKQRELADRVRAHTPRPGWKTPQAKVLESGKSLLFQEITDPYSDGIAQDEEHADAMRAAGVRSMMALPLHARGKELGALTFVVGDSGRRYSARDLALAEEVARRVAAGLENAWLYERAQAAIRAREDLLAIVSHDLKNPLASVLLSISLLLKSPEDGDRKSQTRKQLELMARSAQRMNRLIEDLLDMASIEGGRLSVDKRRLDVGPLVSEALEALSQLAATKSLHLENELLAELPALSADRPRVQQVFANLLGNAIKFTPKDGTIAVRAERSGDWMVFSVRDTGVGISENDLPHVFERLWQVTSTARQGTGLGLFIVKGVVEAHGGRVWIESRVGQGTAVFFTLPVAQWDADRQDDDRSASNRKPDVLQAEVDKPLVETGERAEAARAHSTRVSHERAGGLGEDFVELVCHELRGLLTAIELVMERMRRDRDAPPTPRQERFIETMFGAVARLDTAIESLLQHALIESGRLVPQMTTFDVGKVADEVIAELRPYAVGKGLTLTVTAEVAVIISDPELTRLILRNLVGNAIKLTERGGVEISIERAAGGCRFAVRDSGPGIPADERVHVFDAFTKGGGMKQQCLPGIGLGWAVAREVASALGGHVELESEVGRGSTLTVTLPSQTNAPREEHAPLH